MLMLMLMLIPIIDEQISPHSTHDIGGAMWLERAAKSIASHVLVVEGNSSLRQ